MSARIEGTFRNGRVELDELPEQVGNGTRVIVIFPSEGTINLRDYGIDEEQAADLRSRLKTFEDWNDPDMDIYDNYDAVKANL